MPEPVSEKFDAFTPAPPLSLALPLVAVMAATCEIGVERGQFCHNIGGRVGDVEATDDLVERGLIGRERRHGDDDRSAGRDDRGDMADIALQGRQGGQHVRGRVGDRQLIGAAARVLKLADRRCVVRQLRDRRADGCIVRDRD